MRDCDSAILCNAETGLCDPRSGKGGAVYITDAAVTFENVVMKGNYAERKGGAIYVLNSALWLFDTAIFNNSAPGGGGGLALDSAQFETRRSFVYRNDAAVRSFPPPVGRPRS